MPFLAKGTYQWRIYDAKQSLGITKMTKANQWQPRWYYVMENKTSGKKYVGQTTAANMDKYCGSGGYWRNHCKKHGGYDRKNIVVLKQIWFEHEADAKYWLDAFRAARPDYWLNTNIEWANAVLESTADSSFAGKGGSALQKQLQAKRIAEGTHHLQGEAGSALQKQLNAKRVANGTHPWAGEAGRQLQAKLIAEGRHNLAGEAGSALAKRLQATRIAEGRHPFAGEAGSLHAKQLVAKQIAEGRHQTQQRSNLKRFYEAATGKTANYNKLPLGCPEEQTLAWLGYDTKAIRYGQLTWRAAA